MRRVALTVECMDFLLDVLRVRLDELDALWFFSDWVDVDPREFGQRLVDLALSQVLRREALFDEVGR